MNGIINFEAFLIAGILLNITPGADTIYIITRSISQGKKAGILSALGISSGALIHCIFVALGLSMLLSRSAMAFDIVNYLGVGYLFFLGYNRIITKSKRNFELDKFENNSSHNKLYISGILTNVLNPKVAMFFLAFIPQFVDPNYTQSSIPFLILGLSF